MRQPLRLTLTLTLSLTAACAEKNDAAIPKDAGESGTLSTQLLQALAALRASGDKLCEQTDRCYPEAIEAGWCNLPTSGFERDWPHEDADVCWLPAYEKDAKATLDALSCLSKSNTQMEKCLQDCPDDGGSLACNEQALDAEDRCVDALARAVGEAVIDESDACDERLHSAL